MIYAEVSTIPVCGYVSAGLLEDAEEQPLGYVTVPLPHTGGDLFGLVVRGDSMKGIGIQDGQVVLLRRQPTFEDRDVVVVLIDGQATLKRIYRHNRGYLLEAENPDYPALFVTRDAVWYSDTATGPEPIRGQALDVQILGLVVGFLSEAIFPIYAA
ncbi:MAG TPA: S24 family peptidase [Rhodothermales bacterium]|nr:S24 family peptidase [Rhodothermales bacterium]